MFQSLFRTCKLKRIISKLNRLPNVCFYSFKDYSINQFKELTTDRIVITEDDLTAYFNNTEMHCSSVVYQFIVNMMHMIPLGVVALRKAIGVAENIEYYTVYVWEDLSYSPVLTRFSIANSRNIMIPLWLHEYSSFLYICSQIAILPAGGFLGIQDSPFLCSSEYASDTIYQSVTKNTCSKDDYFPFFADGMGNYFLICKNAEYLLYYCHESLELYQTKIDLTSFLLSFWSAPSKCFGYSALL